MKHPFLSPFFLVMVPAIAMAQAPASIAGQTLRTAFSDTIPNAREFAVDFHSDGTFIARVQTVATGTGGAYQYIAPISGTYAYAVTSANTATVSTSPALYITGSGPWIFSSPTAGTIPVGYPLAQFSLLPTNGQPSARALINMSVLVPTVQGISTSFGFVVGGNAAFREVLIRAVGPSLSGFGVSNVAANPVYQLNNPSGTLTLGPGSGTNGAVWGATPASAATISAEDSQAGAFPLAQGSNDKADVYMLAPGNYTITVSPTNASQAGNVLVEVYEVE